MDAKLCALAVNNLDSDPAKVIKEFHNSTVGHFGINQTLKLLRESGLKWSSMIDDVTSYVESYSLPGSSSIALIGNFLSMLENGQAG